MPSIAPNNDLVVVTGAGRGIGRAIALEISKSGAMVLCISRSKNCVTTAAEIRAKNGQAEALELDLAAYAIAEKRVAEWLEGQSFRRIGAVLAAGFLGPSGSLMETQLEGWDLTWRTNVLGNLAIARALLLTMQRERFGRLLFFAGGGAAYAYPLFPAYAASKTALARIVENMHEDLKDAGDIKVAIVAPGAVDTDILAIVRAQGGEVRTTVAMEEPVAFACAFLSASHCAFSGAFVHVRDAWKPLLEKSGALRNPDLWKLRRVE
jgi:NAD(P)-dependent dehydrogenase (short-subunit alcohol dehydrogenase family)